VAPLGSVCGGRHESRRLPLFRAHPAEKEYGEIPANSEFLNLDGKEFAEPASAN
jgi:hypothetical protein